MNLNIILGIIAIIFAVITVIGMIINNLDYWLVVDIFIIIAAPIVGYKLLKQK